MPRGTRGAVPAAVVAFAAVLERLRRRARARSMKLDDLAREVIADRTLRPGGRPET